MNFNNLFKNVFTAENSSNENEDYVKIPELEAMKSKYELGFVKDYSEAFNKYLNTTKLNISEKETDDFYNVLRFFDRKLGLPETTPENDVLYIFASYISCIYNDFTLLKYQKNLNISENTYCIDYCIYNSQRNNKIRPSAVCNITSQWMQFSSYEEFRKLNLTDDNIWEKVNSVNMINWVEYNIKKDYASWGWLKPWISNKTLNEVYSVLAQNGQNLLQDSGIKDKRYSFESIPVKDLGKTVKISGKPVVFGSGFVGGGHIVCCLGQIGNFLIIHDPWGNWNSGYQDHDGAFRLYSIQKIESVSGKNKSVYSLVIK